MFNFNNNLTGSSFKPKLFKLNKFIFVFVMDLKRYQKMAKVDV